MSGDRDLLWLGAGVGGLLIVASLIGLVLKLTVKSENGRATVANLNARTRAWWVMVLVFGAALVAGKTTLVVLFGLLSFLGLREFITLTPTKRGDHRALFWAFFVIIPAQYYFVGADWYGMFSIFIPVWVFLFIPIRTALAGDCDNFLERAAKTQWGLMVCVYCLSYTPALLTLGIKGYEGQNAKLVVYLLAVAQLSDVFQYVWGKTLGRHKIAPTVSPSKNVGRSGRRGAHGHGDRRRTVVGDAVHSGPVGVVLACDYAGGILRRLGHVRDQTRPGRQGLWAR